MLFAIFAKLPDTTGFVYTYLVRAFGAHFGTQNGFFVFTIN